MSISLSLHLSPSWSASSSSASSSLHGVASELCSPTVRVATRRGYRKRGWRGAIRKRDELQIGRNCRGYVSCSASEESSGSAHESFSAGPGPELRDGVITFFREGSSSRGGRDSSGAGGEMGSSEAKRRSDPPLGAVSNPLFTIESTPLVERMESFEKLNWQAKVTVSAVVVAGLAAASFAGVKLVRGLHGGVRNLASMKGGSKEGGSGGSLAYDVVAKGFSTVQKNLGPWSFSDLTLGLAAISKVSLIVLHFCE